MSLVFPSDRKKVSQCFARFNEQPVGKQFNNAEESAAKSLPSASSVVSVHQTTWNSTGSPSKIIIVYKHGVKCCCFFCCIDHQVSDLLPVRITNRKLRRGKKLSLWAQKEKKFFFVADGFFFSFLSLCRGSVRVETTLE